MMAYLLKINELVAKIRQCTYLILGIQPIISLTKSQLSKWENYNAIIFSQFYHAAIPYISYP